MTTLREFQGPTARTVIRAGADRKALEDAILTDLVKAYNKAGSALSKDLGGGKFELRASWKRQELKAKARLMADSLSRTVQSERERIAALPQGERAAARKAMETYKTQQLRDIVQAEGSFQAQTDIMAHSGLVDVTKSKVMWWIIGGTRTCDYCLAIRAGNPYTLRRATTLGPKAHPNCRDHFAGNWQINAATLAHAKRQVADGEKTVWDGGRQTPAAGPTGKRTVYLRPRAGGWRGLRTEQKKLLTQQGTG